MALAAKLKTSNKHLQIDKATQTMMMVVGFSTVAIVFSLLSTKALLSQSSYQKRALAEKNKAIVQLQDNIKAANTLKTQYDVFAKGNPNIIGGIGGTNVTTSAGQDGSNSKIVLDALPSQYDFPALISSLEKIATTDHITLKGVTGTDEGVNGSGGTQGALGGTVDPALSALTSPTGSSGSQSGPIQMNFSLSAETDYNNTLTLIKDFERSIRPFDVTTFSLSGTASNTTVTLEAFTYYQPGVTLEIGKKEVK